MHLKIKNCCLKIFVKICVGEKMWKYVKYCLKTENGGLKTQTKHPLNVFFLLLMHWVKDGGNRGLLLVLLFLGGERERERERES